MIIWWGLLQIKHHKIVFLFNSLSVSLAKRLLRLILSSWAMVHPLHRHLHHQRLQRQIHVRTLQQLVPSNVAQQRLGIGLKWVSMTNAIPKKVHALSIAIICLSTIGVSMMQCSILFFLGTCRLLNMAVLSGSLAPTIGCRTPTDHTTDALRLHV